MKMAPSRAVVSEPEPVAVHVAPVMADTASTMVSELISSTNELTDVNGMS